MAALSDSGAMGGCIQLVHFSTPLARSLCALAGRALPRWTIVGRYGTYVHVYRRVPSSELMPQGISCFLCSSWTNIGTKTGLGYPLAVPRARIRMSQKTGSSGLGSPSDTAESQASPGQASPASTPLHSLSTILPFTLSPCIAAALGHLRNDFAISPCPPDRLMYGSYVIKPGSTRYHGRVSTTDVIRRFLRGCASSRTSHPVFSAIPFVCARVNPFYLTPKLPNRLVDSAP